LIAATDKALDKACTDIDEKVELNFAKNWHYCEDVEKKTGDEISRAKKTIDNMKFELVEILDTK